MNRREFLGTVGVAAWSAASVGARQSRDFDFIIVGASASGCVLANRLSADPLVRVLVLDSGDDGSGGTGGMVFARGHRSCYDGWAAIGNAGWGYDDLLPLFKRSERCEGGESELRGGEGLLAVSLCTDATAVHRAFLAAAWQNGFKADARFDFNQPTPSNIAGYHQKTMIDGKPQSVADAFLAPVRSRPNLLVTSDARPARLIVEGRRAVGVECIRDTTRVVFRATREVMLCGGAIESPKLLLLSGIGPADRVRALGITVAADLPGVGLNLHNHVSLTMRWAGRDAMPVSTVSAGMFTRSAQGVAGRAPDLHIHVDSSTVPSDLTIAIAISLVQPDSRGEVLRSQADVDALVRGVRFVRFLAEADAFRELTTGEIDPGVAAKADGDLATFVGRRAVVSSAGVGTCKMGPATDSQAVVDAALRVRGLEGLRVADASVMPEIVNAPLLAAAVVIGEKAAELVR